MKKLTKTHQAGTRKDAEHNQSMVRDSFMKLLHQNKGRKPTTRELSEECGLNPTTIKKHVKELNLTNEAYKTFRILSDDVVLAIYRAAMKGNPASQKLWFQLVEGWSEKTETKHSGEIKTDDNKPPVIIKITK